MLNTIGILLEMFGAFYLVAIAWQAKRDARARGLRGAEVNYNMLGPLLTTLLRAMESNYEHELVAFAYLFVGLALQLISAF